MTTHARGAGRPPTPTALKVLRGNPGKRPLNDREPTAAPKLPPAPRHMSAEAKAEWRRVGRILLDLRVMTEADRAALTVYCENWARYVDAETHLQQFGTVITAASGYPVQSPYLAIANKSSMIMMRVLMEFGMTPSSRSRVAAAEPDEDSVLDDILDRRRGA